MEAFLTVRVYCPVKGFTFKVLRGINDFINLEPSRHIRHIRRDTMRSRGSDHGVATASRYN